MFFFLLLFPASCLLSFAVKFFEVHFVRDNYKAQHNGKRSHFLILEHLGEPYLTYSMTPLKHFVEAAWMFCFLSEWYQSGIYFCFLLHFSVTLTPTPPIVVARRGQTDNVMKMKWKIPKSRMKFERTAFCINT